jgi:hypothetical protein
VFACLSVIPAGNLLSEAKELHGRDGRHILFRLSCSIMTQCQVCTIFRAVFKPPFTGTQKSSLGVNQKTNSFEIEEFSTDCK